MAHVINYNGPKSPVHFNSDTDTYSVDASKIFARGTKIPREFTLWTPTGDHQFKYVRTVKREDGRPAYWAYKSARGAQFEIFN